MPAVALQVMLSKFRIMMLRASKTGKLLNTGLIGMEQARALFSRPHKKLTLDEKAFYSQAQVRVTSLSHVLALLTASASVDFKRPVPANGGPTLS